MRKTFREYKKVKEEADDSRVDQKQKEFYENLFKGEPETVVPNNRREPTPKGGNKEGDRKETNETSGAEGK